MAQLARLERPASFFCFGIEKVIDMHIVCLAWGSLLWKPAPLELAAPWRAGGPALPLEFARDSDDSDELAIVLCDGAAPVPTFYAPLAVTTIDAARAMLRKREKVDAAHPEWIGSIPAVAGGASSAIVAAWLAASEFDGVVWTAVPPKFAGVEGRVPTADEAVELLSSLRGATRDHAEEYIRRVPDAIMTPYRTRFERELGWTPAATVK
jgi:hypothetical protein